MRRLLGVLVGGSTIAIGYVFAKGGPAEDFVVGGDDGFVMSGWKVLGGALVILAGCTQLHRQLNFESSIAGTNRDLRRAKLVTVAIPAAIVAALFFTSTPNSANAQGSTKGPPNTNAVLACQSLQIVIAPSTTSAQRIRAMNAATANADAAAALDGKYQSLARNLELARILAGSSSPSATDAAAEALGDVWDDCAEAGVTLS